MDAGVFELKIQLFLWENNANFNVVWKFDWKFAVKLSYPSWNFDWKFAVKLSYPPESLHWKFQWKFQGPLKVSLKLSLQNFKGVWKFDWNFQCKLSRGYESLTANFQPNFQGGMKVWLQTFNQSFKGYASLTAKFQSKFQGVCKFDCKCSTKLSMQSKKKHQRCSNMLVVFVWNQSNPPRFVQFFPHNNDQMYYFLVKIK